LETRGTTKPPQKKKKEHPKIKKKTFFVDGDKDGAPPGMRVGESRYHNLKEGGKDKGSGQLRACTPGVKKVKAIRSKVAGTKRRRKKQTKNQGTCRGQTKSNERSRRDRAPGGAKTFGEYFQKR